MKGFIHSLLPRKVSMGLTIGVRFIEGGKSKCFLIVNTILLSKAFGN